MTDSRARHMHASSREMELVDMFEELIHESSYITEEQYSDVVYKLRTLIKSTAYTASPKRWA